MRCRRRTASPFSQIAVLTTHTNARDALLDGPIDGCPLVRWADRSEDAVLCETVHRAKGLERTAVILVDMSGEPDKVLLYVGASRAVSVLRLVGPPGLAHAAGVAPGATVLLSDVVSAAMDLGLRRIAIVNRGEAAMRLVNAVRELRHEHEADIRTIALHTRAERGAMFVRESDEAVCIDEGRASTAGNPYLDLDALRRALVAARADSAWVGWGFVAERPEFAELCDDLGIVFIGPSAEVMRRLGDKIGAKLLAEQAGVPVAPWSGGPVHTIEQAHEHAAAIGFPLMIKATSGGGGRGIRKVDDAAGLAEAFDSARAEGLKAFGDATVFMERVVTGARHVEVQLIADSHGTVWAVGVRDCSLQRRNQKVMEESHCIALTAEQDRDLRAAAVRLAEAAGYQNAGTVEFLFQPDEQLLRLPRGQHPAPGRAPRHRADDGPRPREAADPRGRRWATGR